PPASRSARSTTWTRPCAAWVAPRCRCPTARSWSGPPSRPSTTSSARRWRWSGGRPSMPDVNMPKLSDTMEEGTVLDWKKGEGPAPRRAGDGGRRAEPDAGHDRPPDGGVEGHRAPLLRDGGGAGGRGGPGAPAAEGAGAGRGPGDDDGPAHPGLRHRADALPG